MLSMNLLDTFTIVLVDYTQPTSLICTVLILWFTALWLLTCIYKSQVIIYLKNSDFISAILESTFFEKYQNITFGIWVDRKYFESIKLILKCKDNLRICDFCIIQETFYIVPVFLIVGVGFAFVLHFRRISLHNSSKY